MPELSIQKRSQILHLRYVQRLGFEAIASQIEGVTRQNAWAFCKITEERAKSTHIEDLLKFIHSTPRSGRPRRVEPGSTTAIRIREQIRGPLRYQQQVEAANHVFSRC
jgi:hypothetical protein